MLDQKTDQQAELGQTGQTQPATPAPAASAAGTVVADYHLRLPDDGTDDPWETGCQLTDTRQNLGSHGFRTSGS